MELKLSLPLILTTQVTTVHNGYLLASWFTTTPRCYQSPQWDRRVNVSLWFLLPPIPLVLLFLLVFVYALFFVFFIVVPGASLRHAVCWGWGLAVANEFRHESYPILNSSLSIIIVPLLFGAMVDHILNWQDLLFAIQDTWFSHMTAIGVGLIMSVERVWQSLTYPAAL